MADDAAQLSVGKTVFLCLQHEVFRHHLFGIGEERHLFPEELKLSLEGDDILYVLEEPFVDT